MQLITWLAKSRYPLQGLALIWGWRESSYYERPTRGLELMSPLLKCLIRWSPRMDAGVLDCALIGCATMATSGITNGYGVFTRRWAWTYPEELKNGSLSYPRCRFLLLPRLTLNCCQFRSTTKESFSIVNHCSNMGWFCINWGTWVWGAGGL